MQGASSGQKEEVLAGLAGLLAGSLSMALGEWISGTEFKRIIRKPNVSEMDELEVNPEGELKEIGIDLQSRKEFLLNKQHKWQQNS